jgi:hypothetical protein
VEIAAAVQAADDGPPSGCNEEHDMPKQSILALPLVSLPLVLCSCSEGVIQSVALAPGQTPALDQQVEVIIGGSGKCTTLGVNWGDNGGQFESFSNADLTAGVHATHTYSGWPGGRTVSVKPQSQCTGSAQTHFVTKPETVSLAWARDPNGNTSTCVEFPGMPPLPQNSIVHITSPPSPVVNFGCPFDGCIYDADGIPGSSADNSFLFPGFRGYSLVLRNGPPNSSTFQGGKSAAPFKVGAGNNLNFCENTDRPNANIAGGWEVDIRVDELGFTN